MKIRLCSGLPLMGLPMMIAVATILSLSLSASSWAQETGTLRMKFVTKADSTADQQLKPTVDQAFCSLEPIPDESVIVNPENSGLKNVIVYAYTGRRGMELPEMDLKAETVVLANEACRFDPRVVIAKVGDTIKVTNPDKIGHNANFSFFNNDAVNRLIPAGGFIEVVPEEAEPAPIAVACNIHPWMKAQVLVLDHPFAAVSNKDGVLEIKGLPVGEAIFRANHDVGSLKDVVVDGEETSWRGSRFEIDIKPGMNDMGTIEVPASAFDQ